MRRIALAATSLALMLLAAPASQAGDLLRMQPAPAYSPAAFNFDGFYLGAQGGGIVGGFSAGSIGVVAGTNYNINDTVFVGAEFQGDYLFNATNSATYDFFALGRAGMVVSDSLVAYADAGLGSIGGTGSYALGGGGEFALADNLSLKGEGLFTGPWGSGIGATKLQMGLLFHLQ